MPDYRVYVFDKAGHIERAQEFSCQNDAEALARLRAQSSYAELWERSRFVKSTDVLVGLNGDDLLAAPGETVVVDEER